MKSKKQNENVLDSVDESRREFVKKLVVGTTFAAPLLASFSMDGALIGEAEADNNGPYFAPYCGDRGVSYSFTARYQSEDKTTRFNATVVADALDGTTVSVVLNFIPRNNFGSAAFIVGGNIAADNLQLGPNVITANNINSKDYLNFGDPCRYLELLTSGDGAISVTTYDEQDTFVAPLVAHD